MKKREDPFALLLEWCYKYFYEVIMIEKISSSNAPKAIGPYSQAIKANGFIFVSGQLPLDPVTGALTTGDIAILTRQVIINIETILQASGSSLQKVVRVDIFLTDLKDFSEMNEEYEKHFKYEPYPARQTIQVSKLPKDASIEISCIALA